MKTAWPTPFWRLWPALWWLTGAVCADEIALVRVGEPWRYVSGANSLPDQWRQPDYDDSSWTSARSGFSFQSGDAATWLSDGAGSATAVYLRKGFTVTDPTAIQWLVLRADYQDGFIAYLNGVEIVRRGLDVGVGSPVPPDAFASPHLPGVAEELDVTAYQGLLRPGTNVLALEGRRSDPANPAFALTPELLANFTRGPLVQNASSNRVQLVWKTPVAASSEVEYGHTVGLGNRQLDTNWVTLHVATLTNLSPDTVYYYRVRSSAGPREAIAPVYRFRTLRPTGGVSFVVVGDTGYGSVGQYEIAQVMQDAAPDLVMHVGDVLYPAFTAGRLDLKCYSVYQPLMRTTPFFFMLGNHDRYDNPVDFLAAFLLPTNEVNGTSQYYSLDHGDAHFVALDTDLRVGNDWSTNGPQYRWLEADLARTTKPWKFLFFHNPLRSSGPHRYDDYNQNGIPDRLEFEASIGVLAARYGVQVVFNAHEHLYERLKPVAGVHSIVTGGGGAILYGFGGEFDGASEEFWTRYNCVKVNVQGDTAELQALGVGGEVFDHLSVRLATAGNPWSRDADADGLPDIWEIAHRLDPYSAVGDNGAAGDPDGDGLTNLQEFWAGTDPRDPGSALRLTQVSVVSNRLALAWSAVVGKNYILEVAEDRPLGFHPLADPTLPRRATGTTEVFVTPMPAPGTTPRARFYRVSHVP